MKRATIYYEARAEASKKDKLFASRERAAEALHVSPEALADYETGVTVPPCDVVAWMVDVYSNPGLKGKHVKEVCPLMTEGYAQSSELSRAALSWMVTLGGVEQIGMEFARISVDGRIDASEREAAMKIRQKAVEMSQVMQETIAAIDTALMGG